MYKRPKRTRIMTAAIALILVSSMIVTFIAALIPWN